MRALAVFALLVAGPAWADTTVPSSGMFQPSSYGLSDDGDTKSFLDAVAEAVKSADGGRVRVEVHADERPGAQDNTLLAGMRARELVKALRKRGVGKKAVVSEAVGHSGVQRTPATSRIVFDFSNDAAVDVPAAW